MASAIKLNNVPNIKKNNINNQHNELYLAIV